MAKAKKKGKMAPATQGASKARAAQLPRLKTSAADLEKPTSDKASESDSSTKDVFYDCRTCECKTTSDQDNNKAGTKDPGKSPVESPGARKSSAASTTSVASPGPTSLDSPRPSLGRSRGHSFSKSIPHTDLEPGKAEEIKASLERIAAEGGPIQTLDEARRLRAEERERVKRIRSDSINLIRERTRSRQNSLNSTRVNSPTSAVFSPTESQPSTPSITVTNEWGLDMPPKEWTDSEITAARIRSRHERNRQAGTNPLAPPNPMNPLNTVNQLGLPLVVPSSMLYNTVNYNERVANYARFHNDHVGRNWGPSQPTGSTPAAYAPSNYRIYTVAEVTEPGALDPAAQAQREVFTLSPRSLKTTIDKPEKKPRVYSSKSCVGKLPDRQTFKSPNNPNPNPNDPDDDDDGDLTDPEEKKPPKKPFNEPHTYTPWAQQVPWFYISDDKALNDECLLAGEKGMIHVSMVEKPEKRLARFPGSTIDSRCDLDPEPSAEQLPTYTYDATNDRFVVHASRQYCFTDVRNAVNHPDFIPYHRILKYQAFEWAGFEVFRHDRRLFKCEYEPCEVDELVDHELRTVLCLGCGTKSSVRYCSKEHLIADIPTHWEVCGQKEVLIELVIDELTQPPRFYRYFPMNADRHDQVTEQRHYQVVYAIYNKGQYTLFPQTEEKFTVEWPKKMRKVMLPRVERLLNVALHDRSCRGPIAYLYRLLRYCLRIQGKWDWNNACQLYWQFAMEFGYKAPVFEWYEDTPCECEWTGVHDFKDKSGKYHTECAFAVKGVGDLVRDKPMKEIVDELECERFILRLWRRRMGVKGWRKRLRGVGFDGVITEDVDFIAKNMWIAWSKIW